MDYIMPNESFFLNYGGPGGYWLSNTEGLTNKLISKCTSYYGGSMWTQQASCMVKGLQATLYSFGIHRALRLDLPPDSPQAVRDSFYDTKKFALTLCDNEYQLIHNNCATTVSIVLNRLDRNLTPNHIISPWRLDDEFKDYIKCLINEKDPTLKNFMHKYRQIVSAEFLFLKKPHWMLHEIQSLAELIEKSHDKKFEERSRSTLYELGWVIGMNHDNKFVLGTKAPKDFREGLRKYYTECQLINQSSEDSKPSSP